MFGSHLSFQNCIDFSFPITKPIFDLKKFQSSTLLIQAFLIPFQIGDRVELETRLTRREKMMREKEKQKKKRKKKKEREKKRAGHTLMLQKWGMSIRPFGSIHAE